VGDGIFVHRCMAKIKDFQDSGGTILFVSHDVGAVTRLCSRTAWMKDGALMAMGKPAEIARQYQAWMYDKINVFSQNEALEEARINKTSTGEASSQPSYLPGRNPFTDTAYKSFSNVKRFGTGRAELVEFKVLNEQGESASFVYPNEALQIVVKVIAFSQVKDPIVGVLIYDRLRTEITGFNTYQLERKLPCLGLEEHLEVEFRFRWPEIQEGSYTLEVAIADGSQESHEMLDWLQCPLSIVSSTIGITFGLIKLPDVEVFYSTRSGAKPSGSI